MHWADWVSTQVVEGVRIKQEDEWDEEAWQREYNALPFMPGVDDAFIKEEEVSDEEPWPPEVQQAPPPGIVEARSSTASSPQSGKAEEDGASSGYGRFKSSDKNYGCP